MVNRRKGQSTPEFILIMLLLIGVGFAIDYLIRGQLLPAQYLAGVKIGQDK